MTYIHTALDYIVFEPAAGPIIPKPCPSFYVRYTVHQYAYLAWNCLQFLTSQGYNESPLVVRGLPGDCKLLPDIAGYNNHEGQAHYEPGSFDGRVKLVAT